MTTSRRLLALLTTLASLLPLAPPGGLAAAPPPAAAEPGSGFAWTDVTEASGIDFRHRNSPTTRKYLIETMGGGVGLLDYDGDGRLDVFFTNGAELRNSMGRDENPRKTDPRFHDRLYRNDGLGRFHDVTAEAGVAGSLGYGMGVAVGDYDNDGRPDLYVTGYPASRLYRNLGSGRFADVTADARALVQGWSSSAAFLDYDGDGRLDLFVCRYVEWDFSLDPYCGERRPGYREYCHPRSFTGITNVVLRNRGDGRFEDVSEPTGLRELVGKALGVVAADLDGDHRPEIYVANDSEPSFLLRYGGNGRFKDMALEAGLAFNEDGAAVAGMGADLADFDNDGRLDAFVTALSSETYSLYRALPGLRYEYVSGPTGVAEASLPFSGWAARLVDLDNDGYKDLFVVQGHVLDTVELTSPVFKYKQPLLQLKGDGRRFRRVADGAVLSHPWAGRGAAFGDIDDDGDLDVVVASCGERALVLRNDGGNAHPWIGLDLEGTSSNRDAVGATVRTVLADGTQQLHLVAPSAGYQSSSDRRLIVGLGAQGQVRKVEVRWPRGAVQELSAPPTRRYLKVREPAPQ